MVSTVGLLSGIAAAGIGRREVILTGVVLIFVEALSMAVGSFLSENSAEEYLAKKEVPIHDAVGGALVMFISYFVLGFVPLIPYVIFPVTIAFWASVILTLIALFILGLASGREFKVSMWRSAVKMSILGGAAIIIGILVGNLIK